MDLEKTFGAQFRHDIGQLFRTGKVGNETRAQQVVERHLTAIRDEVTARYGEEVYQREAPAILAWLVRCAVTVYQQQSARLN